MGRLYVNRVPMCLVFQYQLFQVEKCLFMVSLQVFNTKTYFKADKIYHQNIFAMW